MGGLKGPTDYSAEPLRNPALIINAKEPFNAEPPPAPLISSFITPTELFFKRNHGPIPILDDPSEYKVEIGGLINTPLSLSLEDIKRFPKHEIIATLQCAGNRRTAMSNVRTVKGVGWGIGALSNGVWGGAWLSDVLNHAGIPLHTYVSAFGGRYVEFISVDACPEENGGPYKASVPLIQATTPADDVLLAYEMNGQELNRDHGYPLRVVVPGVIGARSVKWLASILVKEEESQGFFMQKDYKMFPPTVDWHNIDWYSRRPLMDFSIQCAICSPHEGILLKQGSEVVLQGYAVCGGGRGVERVDVSIDDGKTWVEAKRFQKRFDSYVGDDVSNARWAWVLWELPIVLNATTTIIAKAVDTSANVQPEDVNSIWNLRGVLNNSWHKIKVYVEPSQPLRHRM